MTRSSNLSPQDSTRFEKILEYLPDPSRETWEQSQVRKAVLELRESLERSEAERR